MILYWIGVRMDVQLPGSTVRINAAVAAILVPVGITVLWLLALLLLMRRVSGNLTVPLDNSLLLTTGWMLFACAVGLRACWRQSETQGPWRRLLGFFASAILPMVLSAAVLSLPGSPGLGVGLLWLSIAGSAVWGIHAEWSVPLGLRRGRGSRRQASAPKPELPETSLLESAGDHLEGDMVQQTTRVRAADGSERISGVAGEAFLSGQRHAAMHIAFCPPFEKTPELEFEQIDGPTARIKVGQLQPYGARLDLRLARAGKDSQRVVVQFEARKLA